MKKSLALLLSIVTLFSCLCIFGHADGIEIRRCVTWKFYPTGPNDPRDYVRASYYADYVTKGEIPVPPDKTPTYKDDRYLYQFLGWKRIYAEDVEPYRLDPSMGYTPSTFVQEPFEEVGDTDVVYCAIYGKSLKKYGVNDDNTVDIKDISMLLSILAGKKYDMVGPGADANGDGITSIVDVTCIVAYLEGDQ